MSNSSKKRNALKHGVIAPEVMLWSEKYLDYEALRAGLHEEWFPQGNTEEYEVNTLLDLLGRGVIQLVGVLKCAAACGKGNRQSGTKKATNLSRSWICMHLIRTWPGSSDWTR